MTYEVTSFTVPKGKEVNLKINTSNRELGMPLKKGDKNHKLPFLQCYHIFSRSGVTYILKNYYEP